MNFARPWLLPVVLAVAGTLPALAVAIPLDVGPAQETIPGNPPVLRVATMPCTGGARCLNGQISALAAAKGQGPGAPMSQAAFGAVPGDRHPDYRMPSLVSAAIDARKGQVSPGTGSRAAGNRLRYGSAVAPPGSVRGSVQGSVRGSGRRMAMLAAWQRSSSPWIRRGAHLPPVAATRRISSRNHEATFLVAGSFRMMGYADDLVRRLSDTPAKVRLAVIEDKVFFRVVTGPIAPSRLPLMRERLATTGIPDAWRLTLCSTDLSPPPCAQE